MKSKRFSGIKKSSQLDPNSINFSNAVFRDLTKKGWSEVCIDSHSTENLVRILEDLFKTKFFTKKDILQPKTDSERFKISLSSEFGLGKFPYHTDGAHYLIPPRFIILRSLSKERSNTATLIIDPLKALNKASSRSLLEDDIYFVITDSGGFYTGLVNKIIRPGFSIFRYNPLVMKRLNNKNRASFDYVLAKTTPDRIQWSTGKAVIIDNWRLLHGREAVKDIERGTRRLERVYLFNQEFHG